MADANTIILTGNLTADPEMRFTTEGKAVTKFSIAVNGFKKDSVQFFNIVTWEKKAEFCGEYLKKGKKVYVQGEAVQRSYEVEGVKKYTFEVVASVVNNLSPKESND